MSCGLKVIPAAWKAAPSQCPGGVAALGGPAGSCWHAAHQQRCLPGPGGAWAPAEMQPGLLHPAPARHGHSHRRCFKRPTQLNRGGGAVKLRENGSMEIHPVVMPLYSQLLGDLWLVNALLTETEAFSCFWGPFCSLVTAFPSLIWNALRYWAKGEVENVAIPKLYFEMK